jgi:uridylate kinase
MISAERAIVIKFGGSAATNESGANKEYLRWFFTTLGPDFTRLFTRAAFIIGGGPRVRRLQAAVDTNAEKDRVGLVALREHAAQLGEVVQEFGMSVESEVPLNPIDAHRIFATQKRFAVALGGLQIGQSTDTVAVTAAELFAQQQLDAQIVILSNVWRIYTADPKTNPDALPIHHSSVQQLINQNVLIDDPARFSPGMNVTIDPVATYNLAKQGQSAPPVFFGHAEDVASIAQFLRQETPQNGTVLQAKMQKTEYFPR